MTAAAGYWRRLMNRHRGRWRRLSAGRFSGIWRFPEIHARSILWVFLLVSVATSVAIVAAPLTIPHGTVSGLYGRANIVDFASLWATLPPVQGAVYYLGDVECHQISSRTIYLNGNEMPVCSRDASLFLFFSVGLMIAAVVKPDFAVSRMLLRLFPARMRGPLEKGNRPIYFVLLLAILFVGPLAADAGMQLITSYESTNPLRFLTGIPSGIFLGLIIGLMVQSLQFMPTPRRLARAQVPPPS